MSTGFSIIGKVAPTHKGVWSASTAYERLDIVSNTQQTASYIARKNVPAGKSLANTEYWGLVLDVNDTLNTVKGATATLDERLTERATDLERMTDGHFRKIQLDADHDVVRYNISSAGVIGTVSAVPGSGIIKCPKHLCLHFSDEDARCYIYFYRRVNDEYVVVWDVFQTVGSADENGYSALNYLRVGNVTSFMIDIPDDTYMQVAIHVNNVEIFGWDGEAFGLHASADATMRTSSGDTTALPAGGSSGLTIPGNAKYVCCSDAAIYAIGGYKDGEMEMLDASAARKFWALPEGYDFFRARLYFGENPYEKITRIGDVSDLTAVVVDARAELPAARARKVVDGCKKVCNLKWTPAKNFFLYKLAAEDTSGFAFKEGVEYNGVPYGSQWFTTHFVGWHVSPHTFINAAADPDSALCNEMLRSWPDIEDDTKVVAFYGTVCSAFATMCDGWPYPQTNAGFVYDPMITLNFAATPPLGAVYSDLDAHCLITERIDHLGDIDAVSVYEAANPNSGRRTRYSNIAKAADECRFRSYYLDGYLDGYGYVAHHLKAAGTLDSVPYADFDDVEIVAAGALPYRGDRCVYTSEDANVRINIKDTSATSLILTPKGGVAVSIPIAGASWIDVRSYLTADGIYYVHTNTNSTQSTFEYRTAEPITYTLTGGVISFSRNDFWYAMCVLRGDKFFTGGEWCAVPCRTDGDYSDWSRDGRSVSSAKCAFYKGEYGAYPVPLTHA